MASETVRVYAIDENDDALAGVLVRVFDSSGVFVTQQYTSIVGSDAYAEVTLDGDDPPIEYTIRLSKTGVAFDGSLGDDSATPQTISIYSPPTAAPSGTNDFTVQGQTFTYPAATDPELCRCSGHVYNHANEPVENFGLVIRPWDPDADQPSSLRVDNGALLITNPLRKRTDVDGYVEFDLRRGAHYLIILEDQPDVPRRVYVPDASSIVLTDLLFSTIRTVTFDPNPMSLSVGDTEAVAVTITVSDGRSFSPSDDQLEFTSDDETVARPVMSGEDLTIHALGAGTATITATLVDQSIFRLPSEPQGLVDLVVNVT